jgi:hypothetical protein
MSHFSFTGTHRIRRMATAVAAVSLAVVPFATVHSAGAVARPKAVCIPTAVDDAYSTAQDTPLTVANPGVTTNDSLCGSDGLVISVAAPTHGTLTGFDDALGGFAYTPDPGFNGTDTFTYRLEDVEGSNTVTVTITVTPLATTTTTAAPTTTATPTTTAAVQAVTAQPAFTG